MILRLRGIAPLRHNSLALVLEFQTVALDILQTPLIGLDTLLEDAVLVLQIAILPLNLPQPLEILLRILQLARSLHVEFLVLSSLGREQLVLAQQTLVVGL